MAKLVVISKSHAGLSYELGRQWVTVGRGLGNTFQITESSISGQHCEVLLNGSELLVRDMRSTNGTFIKGKVVTEGVLRIGEILQLGEVELRLEPSGQPAVPSVFGTATEKKLIQAAATPAMPVNGARKHQVLLVDDSMAFLETASELFDSFANGEWEIHKACGADQALSIIQQHRIEVAVLDINMPMLDGVQLLGMLHRRHPEVKKVVLTGQSSDSQRAHCLTSGAELFLEKPVTKDGMRFVFNVLNDAITWKHREGFAGTLQVGLTDIVQIECLRRSSCILEVHSPDSRGEIYIESGVIVHAASGELSGQKALHRLLSLNHGQFHLFPYRQPANRTVQGSWEWLLMESARVRDEERIIPPSEKTVIITRTNGEAKGIPKDLHIPKNGAPESKPPAKPQKAELPDLGNDIVVVSTYDGKWNPVDDKK